METKKLYRLAAGMTEAVSLTCAVLAYTLAYVKIVECPVATWPEIAWFAIAGVVFVIPKVYFSHKANEGRYWIENVYRCPVCEAEWIEFEDGPCDCDCYVCGEERVPPCSSRPFVR